MGLGSVAFDACEICSLCAGDDDEDDGADDDGDGNMFKVLLLNMTALHDI